MQGICITISISFVNRFNIASIVLSLSLIDNLRTILLFAVVVSIRHRIKEYPTFLVWDMMTPTFPPRCRKCENSEKNQGTPGGPVGTLYNPF